MAEPPYGIIANSLKAGRVVPFLGAGASFVGRPPGAAWRPGAAPAFLPSGAELAAFLAEESGLPSDDPDDREDLAKVSSYYADVSGRRVLRARLRDVLTASGEPGALHRFLAARDAPMVMVITNYDTLLERAFVEAGRPFHLVVYPADRRDIAGGVLWFRPGAALPEVKATGDLDIDLTRETVLYKMHGTLSPTEEAQDNFVITEEDYVEFLSRMTTNAAIPSLFFPHFRERSFLFLGYSLRDWNLRVVLRNLSRFLARRGPDDEEPLPSWAIQRDPSALEQQLWTRRNVHIYDLPLEEFVSRIGERFQP